MIVEIGFEALKIRVRPSPETNDHEVRLLGDGEDLIDRFWDGMIGLDPDDLLLEPCVLEPAAAPHRATVARCDCGVIGCGSIEIEVRTEGDHVLWIDGERTLRFRLGQYVDEVARAQGDSSWETPDRTAARLVRTNVDQQALAEHGLSFGWASGRVAARSITVSLQLNPGPYQVLVTIPWRDGSSEDVAALTLDLLRRDPRSWQSVQYVPQNVDLPTPVVSGPGWQRGAG